MAYGIFCSIDVPRLEYLMEHIREFCKPYESGSEVPKSSGRFGGVFGSMEGRVLLLCLSVSFYRKNIWLHVLC